jgi:glucose-6-phosphate dehydrogenase assembly protein OpcA
MSAAAAPAFDVLGQEVATSGVNSALRQLWQAADSSKTRASLVNFVIYSEDAARLEVNTASLGEITREHACRAMLVMNTPAAGPEPRAWVQAHCQLYDGKSSVCCEQLSFALPEATSDEVANIIFSNVESDLPLIVWWQGELTGLFSERLYSVMDGLIIDSCQWQHPHESFEALSAALSGRTTRFALADLAWMRSHSLRAALATAAQDQRVRSALPEMNKLSLTHAPGARVTALLFAAWVGTQLGCTTGGKDLQLLRKEGCDIQVQLTEAADGCAIQSVELSGPSVSISAKRDAGSRFARTLTRCGTAQREDLLPADLQSDAELVTEQLSRLGGTSRYLKVLPLLRHWV